MYGKNVSKDSFISIFLIPCLMSLFFFSSRNNALTVYIAASVLLNYRSTFYGLWLWISQLSLPKSLPRKETRSLAVPFFTKGVLHANCCTSALSLFTSEATMAYKALLLNFLFWLLTKGPRVKAEMSIHLLAFRKGKGPTIHSWHRGVHSQEGTRNLQLQNQSAKRNSFILQPTVCECSHTFKLQFTGKVKVVEEKSVLMNIGSLYALTSRKCSACCSRSNFLEVVVIRPV